MNYGEDIIELSENDDDDDCVVSNFWVKNSAKINDDELILRRKKQNADRARAYRKRKKDFDAMPSTSTVQSEEPVSENIVTAKLLHQKQLNMERCRRYRQKCKGLKSGANLNRGNIESNTSTSRESICNPEEFQNSSDHHSKIFENVVYKDTNLKKNSKHKNPLLTEFIETCLKIENSDEMRNIINKTLLKNYMLTDVKFRESHTIEKALRRANNLIKDKPTFKYSHIKDLCEIFKSSRIKKRVQLITLTSNIKEKKIPSQEVTQTSCKSEEKMKSKKQKIDIIDLDLFEELPTIDPDEEGIVKNSVSNRICEDGEKENDHINSLNYNTDENELLLPLRELKSDNNLDSNINEQINKINEEIAQCKRVIAKLDEQEVSIDTKNSPYLKCERLKARIVFLHKELCKLTGEAPVRKTKIHLKVIDGHQVAPVQRLEKFLNRNVGSDGNPLFPNFRDVVKCVLKANERDNLRWTQQQIMNEASALFTLCGRALQKRRQQREWCDLLSKVNMEDVHDPADDDPELLARLEANRLIAMKKETEILDRYSNMQSLPQRKDTTAGNRAIDNDDECFQSSDSDVDSSSDESESKQLPNNSLEQIASTSYAIHKDINLNNRITAENSEIEANDMSMVKVKKEPEMWLNKILDELGENYKTSIEIEDPYVFIEISDSSSENSE